MSNMTRLPGLKPITLPAGSRSVQLDTPVILAPLSGVTDLPFRRMAKRHGAGLVVSEMIASWAMIRENQATLRMADRDGLDGPSAVQLAGCEPAAMAEAARIAVDLGADLVDINFGCPVKKVAVGQAAGSALMRDEAHAGRLLEATVRAVDVPVTLKMRMGWDHQSLNAPALAGIAEAAWQNWYRYLPYEDFRQGRPRQLDAIEARLAAWAAEPEDCATRTRRLDRLGLTFGMNGGTWNEERVLERYELLFEAGLIPEAQGQSGEAHDADLTVTGHPMALDHRRVLATAIGRLRGKIKYRPVVFELMPPTFTLFQLQRTVEALSGTNLHKQNFRRLVAQQGLVEETDGVTSGATGRPARLVRFRREVLLERPAPGFRLRPVRRPA